MLLLSWLEALKTGFVRGHFGGQQRGRQARRIDDASRWGTVWVAPKGEVLEDRALLATLYVDNATDLMVTGDNDMSGTLTVGDTVTWNTGGTAHPAGEQMGLVFGTNVFAAINDAINASASGDSVAVAAGTYAENVVFPVATETLTLLGANHVTSPNTGVRSAETIIAPASGHGLFLQNTGPNKTVSVKGFEVTAPDPGGAFIYNNSSAGFLTNITLEKNRFISSGQVGIDVGNNTTVVTFSDNFVSGATGNGLQVQRTGTGTLSTTVTDNVFHTLTAAGIQSEGSTGITISGNKITAADSHGIQLSNPTGTSLVTNNEVITANLLNNTSGRGALTLGGTVTGTVTVENNKFNGSARGIGVRDSANIDGASVVIRHNDLSGNSIAAIGYGTGTGTAILNTSLNYFGTTNPAAVTLGGARAGQIDFSPMLTLGDTNLSTTGFQHDASSLIVHTLGNQFGGASRIAEAVANLADGSLTGAARTISLPVTTFSETVTIDRDLTLDGAGPASTVIAGGAGAGIVTASGAGTLILKDLTVSGTPPTSNPVSTAISLNNALLIDNSSNSTTVTGTTGNDSARIRNNGGVLEVSTDGGTTWAPVATGPITFDGGDGNDTLTLDLTSEPGVTITFNGGNPTSGTGDKLVLTGGSYTTGTFNFTNAADGSVVIGGTTVNYTGLEPVSSSVTLTNVVLNYSTTAETITVQQFGGDATRTEVTSTAGESVDFVNPTGTLTINAGDTGNDVVNVTGFGTSNSGAPGSVVINGEGGSDTVSFSNTATITGTLDVTAETISQSAGALTITGLTTLVASSAGNITLNQAGNNFSSVAVTSANDVTLRDAGALILAASTISGDLDVTTGGALTDSGALVVTLTTTINAGANVVTLDTATNDFGGAVAITASDLTVVDVDDLTLGAVTASAGQVVTLSTDLNIGATVSATSNIVLQPSPLNQTIGLGGGAGGFTLTEAELQFLSTPALVSIGRADMGGGTGAVDINNIDLSAETFDLTIRGGSMSLDSITLANNKNLTLNSTGSISDTNVGTANITIGGGTGTAILTSATGIGTGNALETNIDRLSAIATTSGNVQITETNSLTIDNPVTATGGSVVVQATGTLTTTASGTVTAGSGTAFLFANDMVLGAAISGSNGVELRTATGGTQITLGTGATGLALSNAELNLVTVGGSAFLTVGDTGAGVATIDSAITLGASAPRLRVLTAGSIAFTSTGALSVTSGVELDGSTITTTSSAASVISAPSSVNLLARTTGIGSTTNPITLAGTSSLSVLTTGNADAFLNTGTASGVQSFNAGSGFVEFQAGTFNLNGSNVINDATQIRLNGGTATLGVGANSDTIGGLTLKSGSVTGTGTLTSASTYLVEGGSISPTLAGTTGAVGLTKSTGGLVSLSGNNTFTGLVSITDGNLTLNRSGGALADGVAVTLTNTANAVLTLNFAETIGSLAGGGGTGGNVNLNGQTLTTGGAGGTTFSGAFSGGGSLIKQGGSTFTYAGTGTVSGGTSVTAGRLDVNGSLTSNVTVTSPGTLGGTGTVTGNVTGTGTVAPGTSPGILNVVGTFGPVGTLAAEINGTTPGTQHDQVNVTGSVNLGGTTVLSTTGSTITSVPGQQIILINNDGTDAVTGTFSGIAEGGTTTVNGLTFFVSYIGGLNGNDVTLTQAGAITITGTAGADGILIQEETILGLDYISYYLNSVLQTRFLSSEVTTITVNAGDGNDTLTINYGASGGFFNKNVIYNGQGQTGSPGDTLVLDDTGTPPTFTTITHSFTNNSDGSVNVDGTAITYTGLEPITDNLNAANRVFTFTGANETIDLTASGANSQLDSTLGESVVFTHPTTSLTINSTNGTDTINLSTIGTGFTANVTINSNAASTVDFNNATGLNVGSGNVVIDDAGTISFSAGSLTTTGNVTLSDVGAGGVTANATGVDIAATGLTISSAGAIGSTTNPLRTSVTTVTSASTTGAGSAIFLTETDAVTLTSVTTTNGAITVVAGGTITATSVTSSTDTDANDISITATTGNIVVGVISSGTTAGDVTLLATTGSVIDNTNDATTDVTGDVVTLTAANGVGESGGNGSLDTAANSLVVSVTGAGPVNLSESNAVTLTSVNTANGSITITAGGTITATSVTSTTDSDANDISITATAGNIVVVAISAGTTAGDVTLLATMGSILDDANDATTDVIGDVVTLTAANGVGAVGGGDSLDTAANSLDVSVTGAGLINLSESDAVTLTDIDTANGSITILAGGAILATNVASTTDSDANDISITATTGNVTVGVVTAGTNAGDVTLVATAGSIIDNANDSSTDVTGDVVTLTAATGVGESAGNGTLDTRANSLVVSVTGAGLVNLSELDAVTLTSVTTANGPITITAGGAITATSVASLTDSDANDIAITATSGNVALGLVRVGAAGTDATAGDITITATSGNLTDIGNDTVVDVQGDVVTLTASGDIGQVGNQDIDSRANSLVLSSNSGSVAGVHGTWVNEFNAVTVTSASTTDGVIFITSAGTMTVSTVTAGNVIGPRDVLLQTTTGDVLLDIVSTTGANASVVRISAAGGIVDNNGSSNNISSNGALLQALTGIGATNALETTVSNLAANNTTSGDIQVTNTGALTITSVTGILSSFSGVTQAGAANILIRALSPLTVLSPVVNSGGGNITLAAEGALTTDDLTLSANVTATGGTGSINLFAGGDILQTTGTVSAASTGTVNLSAGENFNGGANAVGFANGNVTQTDGAVISSVSGVVNLEATGSVNLASVSTAGDVNVSADDNDFGLADTTGAITDNRTSGEGTGFTNIVGATVNLFAASGIGNGTGVLGEIADIDINATNLNATNLTSGAIQVFEVDSVALGLVDNATRVVVIEAGASITDQDNSTGNDITADTIHLRAVSGIGGTGVNAAIETTAATVNATNTTSGGIFLNSLSVVNFNNINAQTTGNIELTSSLAATLTTVNADSGNIVATVTSGNLTVASSVTAGGAGDIDFVTLSGNIVLTGTTTAAGDDVTMVSSGNITGNGLVTGNTFSGLAATGIGVSTANRVQTAVSLIRMGVTGGSIFVNNTSSSLTTFSLTAPAGTGITASGVVDLTTSNDLTVANGALVVAGGTATLQGGAANTGATIFLNDTVDGTTVTVLGGTGADSITVNDMSATNVLNLDGQAGSDSYTINYGSAFMPGSTANIDIEDTSTGVDSDVININGTNAVDTFNVKEDAQLAGNFRTTITGGHTGRVNYFAEPLTTAINAGLTRVNVSSLGDQDFFFVAPSRFFEIFLFGGLPSFGPAPTDVPQVGIGDTLDFDPYGNTFTIDIRTFLTDGGTPAFQGVSFSNIENVPLTPIGTGSRFFDFDRVDLGSGTGTADPLPSAYSPLATGYERVIERDLYIPTDLAYTDIMGRPGYSDPAKRYGWEVVGTPEVMADGRIRGPVKGYEYTGNTAELAASQFGDVVRDGNWSTDQNTNAIFRFEMPSADSWYLVSAKVGQRNGAIDQVRIRNASTGYLLAQNISTTVNNIAEVKFPVKTDANGVIRLQFEDAGGQHPWWFLAGLEVRPGKILSFGGPPVDLVADGQTIDTLTAYNLSDNAIVTINPTYGTAITTGAFPDVDPVMNGYQRPTEPDPMNPGKFIVRYTIQRPSGPGFAYIAMGEVSTGFTGDVIGDTGSQEINYIAPPTRRFDFGTGVSPVQDPVATVSVPGGYIGVAAGDVYTSTSGYGWSSAVTAGDVGAGPVTGSAFANLLRDYNYATSARNFIIDLPAAGAGGDVYDLVAIVGDAGTSSLANQTISVVGGGAMVSGTEVTNYSYNGGTWKALRFTVNRTGSAPLQLQFSGGASGQRWQINGLELRLATTVAAVTVTPPGGTPTADGTTIDTFTVSAAGLTGRTLSLSLDHGTITAINGTPVASADADAFFTGLQFVPGADSFTVSVRRPGSAVTATLTVQDVTGAFRGTGSQTYAAAPAATARLFDFGATTSVAPSGYTLVTPSSTYSTALGFGWQNSVNASDVATLSGTTNADLLKDSISASIARTGLFRVDLPNGTYQVTAVLGDPSSNRNGMQVRWSANGGGSYTTGVSGVTTVGGQFTHVTFPITVTGGNVILEFSSTLSPFIWRAASLEIRSAAGTVNIAGPAGPVAGDGTTDLYTVTGGTPNATYTITTSLGTLVTADADTRFSGVQVVADGAGSFTFQVMRPITNGTNNITVTEVTGARTGSFATTYSVAGTRSFDFNGSNNITEAGFIGVRANVIFSATVGYGWLVAQTERDNGTPASNLLRDGHIGTSGTFRVVATPGLTYTLTMQFRDTTTRNITITGEGVAPVSFTVPANTTVMQTINLPVSASADGMLDLLVARTGTTGTFIINSLVVATPQLAEGGFGAGSSAVVSEADLADVIAAAKDRWVATGLTPEQMLALNGVRFEVSDLGITGGAYVGLAYSPSLIKIDDDAAGWGWFIDSTPGDDAEFLPSGPSSLAALAGAGGRFDLLTVVMHELGNALKLSGLGTPASADGLMGTTLGVGTRRLPGAVRGVVADATSSTTTTSVTSTGLALALDDRAPVGASTKVAAPASAGVDSGVTAPIALPKRSAAETSDLDAVFSLAAQKPVLDDLWAE